MTHGVDDAHLARELEAVPFAQRGVHGLGDRLLVVAGGPRARILEWHHGVLRRIHAAREDVELVAPKRSGCGQAHREHGDTGGPQPRTLREGPADGARGQRLAGVADCCGERRAECACVVEAVIGRHRERLGDHGLDGRRHIVAIFAQEWRGPGDALRQELLGRLAHERRHAGDGLVQHARQGVHVAPPVERAVARLLGTHVGGRARDGPLLRDLLVRAVDRARDAEVRKHRVAAGEEDVFGLDVAVHHAALVRVGQRAGHLAPDAHGFLHREPVVRAQPLPHRVALDVRHHIVELVVRLSRIVDGEDVRVLEARGELDLAKEALGTERMRQLVVQHLDRHEPLVAHVVREIDRRRSPTADLPLQDIASGERFMKKWRDVEHGFPVCGDER